MAISIRNPEVESLARDLAGRTGRGMTEEILAALVERKERLEQQTFARLKRIQGIVTRCAELPVLDPRTPEAILGYNDEGGF